GRRTALLRHGGRTIELSGRHAELLTLLHLHPDGISGGELAEQLHGDRAAEGTVRAEVVRLRKVLSTVDGLEIASRPYRLAGAVASDLRRARAALARGDAEGALAHWSGDLLPASEAPAIRRLGRREGAHLRELLLERGTAAQLWRYAQRPDADGDLEVLMAILELAPADAPEGSAAVARAHALRGDRDERRTVRATCRGLRCRASDDAVGSAPQRKERHDGLRTPRHRGREGQFRAPLRELHRRPVGAARQGRVLREPPPRDR